MIETFEGRIGGGKSLSAVHRAMLTWANSGLVCTNIAINWDKCCDYGRKRLGMEFHPSQLVMLSDDQIARFWNHTPSGTREKPVLVIIDEADVWIGNQTTGVKVDPEFLRFLKQSRKMGTDIIFITQALKNLHSQVSRLNQHVWRFRDMEKWKIKSFGIAWPFPQILQIQYDYDGKTEMHRRFWMKDKDLFGCYDTNALYGGIFERLDKFDAQSVQAKRIAKKQFDVPTWWLAVAASVLAVSALLYL